MKKQRAWLRRAGAMVLSLAMCLSLMVTGAWAAPKRDSFTVTAGGTRVSGTANSSAYTTEYVIDSDEGEGPVTVSVSGSTAKGRIIVKADATITLDNVTMDLKWCKGGPIEIKENVSVTLILKGTNTISSFADGPGILVNQNAKLTIREDSETRSDYVRVVHANFALQTICQERL